MTKSTKANSITYLIKKGYLNQRSYIPSTLATSNTWERFSQNANLSFLFIQHCIASCNNFIYKKNRVVAIGL